MLNHVIKIVISGDGGVGKTTLLYRYVNDVFEFETKLTKGLEFFSKKINMHDNTYELVVWDLGGQEQFRNLYSRTNLLGGTVGALLLFDLTRYYTLNNLDFWLDILSQCGDFPIMIIGSKYDMINGDTKEMDDTVSKILENNKNCFNYLKTSSLTGKNVNKTFELLAKEVLKKMSV